MILKEKQGLERLFAHHSIILSSKNVETTQVSITDERISKVCNTERNINQSYREREPYATTWVNLEDLMLSKISQSRKDKQHTIPLM